MDIAYLKNVYNFTMDKNVYGLIYFDKLSNKHQPVKHLSKDKYQILYDLFLKFKSNKDYKKLYDRIDKYFNILLNGNKKCFAPVSHLLTRQRINQYSIHTRNRIIIDSAQIIINDDFTKIIKIHHPNNSISYSKFKKQKKDDKDKKKCSGCYPYFQPNQLAHMNPNGCLYVEDDNN